MYTGEPSKRESTSAQERVHGVFVYNSLFYQGIQKMSTNTSIFKSTRVQVQVHLQ